LVKFANSWKKQGVIEVKGNKIRVNDKFHNWLYKKDPNYLSMASSHEKDPKRFTRAT